MKRVCLIVMDSVGIGALPDAQDFHDEISHTLGNILKVRGRLDIPNLTALGLGNIEGSRLPMTDKPAAAYGRAAEATHAKDTTSGHWEIAGLPLSVPLQTFPSGFPDEIIQTFETQIGRKVLCNRPASGTAIINEFGDEHMRTGYPIVYTSADSVFQIAAHEAVIPLQEQYHICETARALLTGEYLIGRVIARPFEGTSGHYTRTSNRKDFSIAPPGDTILDALKRRGLITAGIGKIEDIFDNRGLNLSDHTHNNADSVEAMLHMLREEEFSFLFVNLVDFDMLYGHRNDVEGYAAALETFDKQIPSIIKTLRADDLLIITADHGCDPTTPSTDHSREYIPILAVANWIKQGESLGTRSSFADIGATIFEYLTGEKWTTGEPFLHSLLKAIRMGAE